MRYRTRIDQWKEQRAEQNLMLTVCRNGVARFSDWSWQARNDPSKNHFLSVKLHISRPPPPESTLVFVWFDNKQFLSEMTENVRFVLRWASKKIDHLHTNSPSFSTLTRGRGSHMSFPRWIIGYRFKTSVDLRQIETVPEYVSHRW